MTKSFRFYYDPGHGWLEVSLADMAEVGLPLSAISRYSYRKGDVLYLEEDCDCGKFVDAFQAKFDCSPHIWECDGGEFIRGLKRVNEWFNFPATEDA
jgi:hypothetical protein